MTRRVNAWNVASGRHKRDCLLMPIIDVTYDGTLNEQVLRRLAEFLPDVVPKLSSVQKSRGAGHLGVR